eukprot:4165019-Prymnesium_polylepis.1
MLIGAVGICPEAKRELGPLLGGELLPLAIAQCVEACLALADQLWVQPNGVPNLFDSCARLRESSGLADRGRDHLYRGQWAVGRAVGGQWASDGCGCSSIGTAHLLCLPDLVWVPPLPACLVERVDKRAQRLGDALSHVAPVLNNLLNVVALTLRPPLTRVRAKVEEVRELLGLGRVAACNLPQPVQQLTTAVR